MENKVFLDNLPKIINEKYDKNKIVIDWRNSIGYVVECRYKDKIYNVKIVDYELNKKYTLTIEYENKKYDITTSGFQKCSLGRVLGMITKDFRFNVGYSFIDKNRNITITNRDLVDITGRDKQVKCYMYKCEVCGYDKGVIREYSLLKGQGCACCAGKVVVEGINDLATVRPDLVKYFKNPNESKNITIGNHSELELICPDCGKEKNMKTYVLVRYGFSCSNCNDGISRPEKFTIGVLKQLKIEFITQLSKKHFKWIGNKRYDFYFKLNDEEYILEVHGEQHYKKESFNSNRNTLFDIQENDKIKKELALANGIKEENYIVVDCRYSNVDWMKEHFINSLKHIFKIKDINWDAVVEFMNLNLSIVIRERWNNRLENEFLMASDINREFGITRSHEYLNFWTSIGKCDYNPKESLRYIAMQNGKLKYKKVSIYKDSVLLGTFDSVAELVRQSVELFGVKLCDSNISRVAKIGTLYKGYTFKYS